MSQNWTTTKISRNLYKLSCIEDNKTITVQLESHIEGDPEILFDMSCNISDDGVLVIPNLYPTPEDDPDPIVGDVYLYENKSCVDKSLLTLHIVSVENISMQGAKRVLENLYM